MAARKTTNDHLELLFQRKSQIIIFYFFNSNDFIFLEKVTKLVNFCHEWNDFEAPQAELCGEPGLLRVSHIVLLAKRHKNRNK